GCARIRNLRTREEFVFFSWDHLTSLHLSLLVSTLSSSCFRPALSSLSIVLGAARCNFCATVVFSSARLPWNHRIWNSIISVQPTCLARCTFGAVTVSGTVQPLFSRLLSFV